MKLNKQIEVGEIYEVTKARLAEIQKAEKERGYQLIEVLQNVTTKKNKTK